MPRIMFAGCSTILNLEQTVFNRAFWAEKHRDVCVVRDNKDVDISLSC